MPDRVRVDRDLIEAAVDRALEEIGGPAKKPEIIERALSGGRFTPAQLAVQNDKGASVLKEQASFVLSDLGKDGRACNPATSVWVHARYATDADWQADRDRRAERARRRPASGVEQVPVAAHAPPPRSAAQEAGTQPGFTEAAAPATWRGTASGDATPAWEAAPSWEQLLSLLIASETAQQLAAPRNTEPPVMALPGAGRVVLGAASGLPVDEEAHGFLTSRRTTRSKSRNGRDWLQPQEILVGWPALRVPKARSHQPLLVVRATYDDETRTLTPARETPWLNHLLVHAAMFDADAVMEAEERLRSYDGGSYEALSTAAARVLEALGAGNADAIHRRLLGDPAGSVSFDLHDTALLSLADRQGSADGMLEELRLLAERRDWQTSAARWFVAPPTSAASAQSPDSTTTSELSTHAPAEDGGGGDDPVFVPADLTLNASQEEAVQNALRLPLTVVAGPPGTGKSQVVATIAANALMRKQSVLIASTNNGAVDAAVARANAGHPAVVLRTGNAEHRERLRATAEELAGSSPESGVRPDVATREVEVTRDARERFLNQLGTRAETQSALTVHVLGHERLTTMLWGAGPGPDERDAERAAQYSVKTRRPTWRARRAQRRLFRDLAGSRPELRQGDIEAWASHRDAIDRLKARLDDLPAYDPDADRQSLRSVDDAWRRVGGDAVRAAAHQALTGARHELLQLSHTRKSSPKAFRAAVAKVRTRLPGWATSALSASGSFPLEAGMFDLLIVDEASTCQIGAILPLAYRARAIVVVGDTNQLSPVVSLSRSATDRVATAVGTSADELERLRLSIGGDSAYTALEARAPSPALLLAEHYRCHPTIAAFVNRTFYGGRLRVLTPVDGQQPVRGLRWVEVEGRSRRGPTGGVINDAEVDAVVAWIAEHHSSIESMGVVSPFAAQAQAIRSQLRNRLGAAVADRITVATAHRFQGDERDVMLFSTALGPGVRPRSAEWVEKERRLVNVAVSRARHAVIAFGHRQTLKTHGVETLLALAEFSREGRHPSSDGAVTASVGLEVHSESERRLHDAMRALGLVVVSKPVVEGYELDFHVHAGDPAVRVNVECDGSHHEDPRGGLRRADLVRDQRLEEIGWTVLRFPAWRCLAEPSEVAAEAATLVTPTP